MNIKIFLALFCCFWGTMLSAQRKYELLIFEGSDWCVYCHALDKQVLQDVVFQKFLDDQHIALQRVDFPRKQKLSEEEIKRNDQLAETYQFEGKFPTVVLVNLQNKKFGVIKNYKHKTAAWTKAIEESISRLE